MVYLKGEHPKIYAMTFVRCYLEGKVVWYRIIVPHT